MTNALILAAGQGTRLRPLTDDKPKCLVPLCGQALLLRQAKTLQQAGINRIMVATGYCRERIENLGFETSYNPRFETTNMVESLFAALPFLKETAEAKQDLIIGYGDIVYEPKNLAAVLACDEDIALMIDAKWYDLWRLRMENPLDDAETLILDEAGYVQELGKKPKDLSQIQGQYTGLIKIAQDKILDLIAFYQALDRSSVIDGKVFDQMYMTSFIQLLINAGWKVKAAIVENGWLEVDTVEDLEHYENLAKTGVLDPFYKVA